MKHLPIRPLVPAILCAATAASVCAPHALSAPPSQLFKSGYDLCKAASLGAVRTAGGQQYLPGRFDSLVCNWERQDFKAGVTLALIRGAQATAVKSELAAVHGTVAGPAGSTLRSTKLPGANVAVIETLPHLNGQTSKAILLVYSQGVVHISMTAPGSLADSRLVAIADALTR